MKPTMVSHISTLNTNGTLSVIETMQFDIPTNQAIPTKV